MEKSTLHTRKESGFENTRLRKATITVGGIEDGWFGFDAISSSNPSTVRLSPNYNTLNELASELFRVFQGIIEYPV